MSTWTREGTFFMIRTQSPLAWFCASGGRVFCGFLWYDCHMNYAAAGAVRIFAPGWYTIRCSYKTKPITTIPDWAYRMAEDHHPAWSRLSRGARALMARNALILTGEGGNDIVEFVVAWTPGGKLVGGAGTTLRMAATLGIPVFNLHGTTPDDVISFADSLMSNTAYK